ncbi:MAG: ATP-binding protein [Lachnospiraceae bacterium]|nr:ATP-binding protein [Lachnospiraceae bacterium]
MFVGRERELQMLARSYQSPDNEMIILYGREGIGKTSLVKQFIENKTVVYYQARELSEEEQNYYLSEKKEELIKKAEKEKVCFILDEFDLIQKGYKTFFTDFAEFMETLPEGKVLTLLLSSSVQWVENSMVSDMGTLAMKISSFIKLKEFTFMEMVDRFPDSTTRECVVIYGILGGIPAYLNLWNPKETVRRNILRIILDDKGVLHREAQRFLKTTLRELPYYSTILSVLAEDEPKLNYLYNRTHFSRAKISVYIKNLIQLDVAAKIFSYEPEKKANIQKGLYGITDAFIHFWYKLIYPNLSDLSLLTPEEFYDKYIRSQLDEVVKKSYMKVCREFMELMNQYNRLPAKFENFGSLYGKRGFIPLVAGNGQGKLLVGECKWSNKPMGMPDFEELLKNIEQIGKEADYYYLFSKEGFTTDFAAMAKNMDNIQCIDLEQM